MHARPGGTDIGRRLIDLAPPSPQSTGPVGSGYGGGGYAAGGSVTLTGDTAQSNTAAGNGGGHSSASAATLYLGPFTLANLTGNGPNASVGSSILQWPTAGTLPRATAEERRRGLMAPAPGGAGGAEVRQQGSCGRRASSRSRSPTRRTAPGPPATAGASSGAGATADGGGGTVAAAVVGRCRGCSPSPDVPARCRRLAAREVGCLAGVRCGDRPLAVRVECVPRRVLSAKALTAVLGEDQVRQLQEEVGPTLCRRLVVSGAPHGDGKSSPRQ
jgi:hypothetical protein